MKNSNKLIKTLCATLIAGGVLWFLAINSTLLFNTRIERIFERDLPRISIEDERIIYCRMQADDFRFPLPQYGIAIDPTLLGGGFDTIEGSVRITYQGGTGMNAQEYESWVRERSQMGGSITVEGDDASSDLIVRFSYFGDR